MDISRTTKYLGIEFVSLNVPMKKHLEVLAAGSMLMLLLGLVPIGLVSTIYILLFTKYWYVACLYLFWIWVVDKNKPEQGGRINQWVRSWTLFKHVRDYFPITVKAVPDFNVDPKRNYLSCGFPHGVMPIGITTAFQTNALKECKDLFPHHKLHALTLKCNFLIPLYREFLLAIGMCSTTPKSLNWLLDCPEGGNVAGLIVGGAAESLYSQEGQYRLVLKHRKGFIKAALKYGAPIIPTFAFGQNNSFRQLVFADDSFGRRFQNWVKQLIGIAPIVVYGRGLFQCTFGLIPLQKPINIVVGRPIDVPRISQPTQEDIDSVHAKFIDNLIELFEQYKYEYEENAKACQLLIS